jgi:hypothetical protein
MQPFSLIGLDSGASDAELLDAVVGHFEATLEGSDKLDSLLGFLGISHELARELRIGLSDRSLGKAIPHSSTALGGALRSRLMELGVLRETGHEAFRGCLVIPLLDAHGAVCALYGRRIDSSRAEVWAGTQPRALFEHPRSSQIPSPTSVIIVPSILEALRVLGALDGDQAFSVIAPGTSRGFASKALADIARRHAEVTVLGRGVAPYGEKLSGLGVSVSVAAEDLSLLSVLGSTAEPADAISALLATSRPHLASEADVSVAPSTKGSEVQRAQPTSSSASSTTMSSPDTQPMTARPNGEGSQELSQAKAPELTATPGRDEIFVKAGSHSWRIRGARAPENLGVERLNVALSVSDVVSGRFYLDTLDLYAAAKRARFLDAACHELKAERELLVAEMVEVIGVAETARDSGSVPEAAVSEEVSDEERAEALEWLAAPGLMERLCGDLSAMGVVGEQLNLLTCYLAGVSRLIERPFGVLVQSSSAAGKSTLLDAVCSLIPPEDLIALSAITPQALYYLDASALKRKVLLVAEEHGALRASYALKLLLSEGRLSIASAGKDRASGRMATKSYETAGPVALMMTTTSTEIDPELENRLVVLGVDEDPSQTRAIIQAQRRGASLEGLLGRRRSSELKRRHRNAQRLLDPYPVVIDSLDAGFPASSTRHRRDHVKLLSVISAITVLHQHQRIKASATIGTESFEYLEASAEDIEIGLELTRSLSAKSAEQLAPQAARLLLWIRGHAEQSALELGVHRAEIEFTRRTAREALGWSDAQIRAATDRLVALEYLVVSRGGRGRCRSYSLVEELGSGLGGPGGDLGQVRVGSTRTEQPLSPGESHEFARFAGFAGDQCLGTSFVVPDERSSDDGAVVVEERT